MDREILLILSSSAAYERIVLREHYKFPPVGILYLSSLLKIHGYNVQICDLVFEDYTKAEFVEHLQSLVKAPVMVGICVYTETANETIQIATLSKQAFPDTNVVLGGPHASFCYEEMLTNPGVDFVVRGEGEISIIKLLEHFTYPDGVPLHSIPNIAYNAVEDDADTVTATGLSALVTNLDILPIPDYQAWSFGEEHYSKIFPIVSSRGCPGRCIFCASKTFSGNKYRFHSPEWIFSVLYYYQKIYKFLSFGFFDDTFLSDKKRATRVCEYIREFWPADHLPAWACKSRVDMIDTRIIESIHNAGCLSIHVGLESGNQGVLNRIKKGITLEQVFNALRILNEYGIEAECSFMIGHPGDTLETIEETLMLADVIENTDMGKCVVSITTPFPATPLREMASELNMNIKVYDWDKYNLNTPIFETPEFTLNHLRKGMSHYNVRRFRQTHPGLSCRSQDEIDEIRNRFRRNLIGEEVLSER